MPAPIDLTGHRYGRLLVTSKGPDKEFPNSKARTQWWCQCDCGNKSLHIGNNLRRGIATSCGCWKDARRVTHGHTIGRHHSATYSSWSSMLSRCYDKNVPSYRNYGSKGVKVCKRWHTFDNFLADKGERPAGKTIGRFGDKGNYRPGNCEWMTKEEQAYHYSRKLKIKGVTKTLKEWAEIHGVNYSTVRGRLNRGWSAKDAVTTPANTRRNR